MKRVKTEDAPSPAKVIFLFIQCELLLINYLLMFKLKSQKNRDSF